MKKLHMILFVLFIFFGSKYLFAQTVFIAQGKASKTDTRLDYDHAALKLALDKTVDKYGTYELVEAGLMNTTRALKTLKSGRLSNFFVKQSVSKKALEEMAYVPFPVDMGIVGYRVFFVSLRVKSQLASVTSLDDLKEFTIGQGDGWLDVDILEYNGFKVIKTGDYEALFRMVAKNRFDLYSRGANELLAEWETHRHILGLECDHAISLYYPLPRFFFTHKKDTDAAKRVTEGLIAAYNDGSLQNIWEKNYKDSIEFVNLKNRKIFQMRNPFLAGVDTSYEKYIYKP